MTATPTLQRLAATAAAFVAASDGWTRIRAPEFAAGPQALTAYAVDPVAPDRMFATNGRVVERSTDGGCTWATVAAIPPDPSAEFPFPGSTTVHAIVIPPAAASIGRVHYLVLREDHGAGLVRPGVLRSSDGGATWTRTLVSEDGEPGELPLGEPVTRWWSPRPRPTRSTYRRPPPRCATPPRTAPHRPPLRARDRPHLPIPRSLHRPLGVGPSDPRRERK